MEWSTAQAIIILVCGAGVFLRLVTKEKQRREKHLQYRLEEQIRKIKEEKEKAAKEAREKAAQATEVGAVAGHVVTVQPR